YQVKTDKKGHFLHAGLPYGTYDVTVSVNGADKDGVKGVPLRGGDAMPLEFDLSKSAAAAAAGQAQAEASKDATRGMSAAEKAERDKQLKEREEAMKKNKELNDAFNAGMAAAQ